MTNDQETKRRLDAFQVQIDRLAKQVTHVLNSEDRIKEATADSERAVKEYVAELLTSLRHDMSESVVSVYKYLFKIDDKREHGQRNATTYRIAMVILLIVELVLNGIVLGFLLVVLFGGR